MSPLYVENTQALSEGLQPLHKCAPCDIRHTGDACPKCGAPVPQPPTPSPSVSTAAPPVAETKENDSPTDWRLEDLSSLLCSAHDEDFRDWAYRMKCEFRGLYGCGGTWGYSPNPQHYVPNRPYRLMELYHRAWWHQFCERGYVISLKPNPDRDVMVVRRGHHENTLYVRKEQPPACISKKPALGYDCRSGWHCECEEEI